MSPRRTDVIVQRRTRQTAPDPVFGPLQRWPELHADPGNWTEHPLIHGYGGPR